MPNIIEQQDLLKGLPDNRLAMLLQNPVADIPPFLVAAEAQRRQAIRQQFSGSQNNESVVDSLTRQLAPKSVSGPAQATPPVPATPDMQGVAALQQQQQMQQMIQQAQDQGMAGGGPVRRFAGQGYVKPTVDSLSSQYFVDPFGIPDVGSDADTSGIEKYFPDLPDLFPQWKTPDQLVAEKAKQREADFNANLGDYNSMNQRDIAAANRRSAMPAMQKSVEEDRQKQAYLDFGKSHGQQPGETADEYRDRLEKLYDQAGPSDWEKSQKWFAMAQQFLDPAQTTMQSVAGAGQAFAGAMADEARAKRTAELEKAKALYEYDLNKASTSRDSALAERKIRTDIATQRLDDMSRRFYDIDKEMSDIRRAVGRAEMTPEEAAAEIKRLKEEKDALGAGIGTLESFLQQTYGFETIPTVDTANNRIR